MIYLAVMGSAVVLLFLTSPRLTLVILSSLPLERPASVTTWW